MRELCLANMTVADAGPIALVEAAAAAKFDSVNLWLTPPPALALFGDLRRDARGIVGDRRAVAELRARLDATGVRVFAGSAGWIGPNFDPATIGPVLETLAALAARAVVIVGWDDVRERLLDRFAAICDAAAPLGLRVHLEFMPYTAVKTLADARSILDACARPNAAILVDALHLVRSGGTPSDVARVAAGKIGSLQLCDGPTRAPWPDDLRRESVSARRYPGEGEFPLDALVASLPPGVVIEAEVPVAADAHLSITERARRAADATRCVLASSRPP